MPKLSPLATPHRIALAIALAWVAFALATLSGFGLTSDSPSLFYAGDRHLYWLFHLGKPNALNFLLPDPGDFHTRFFRFPEPADPVHYPVFPGFIAAITGAIFGPDGLHWLGAIDSHQLGLALLQAVNLYLFARYACALLGDLAGGTATLFLAFFPCIIGHAINNAKDTPCTVLYGVTLLAGARGLMRKSVRDLLVAGVAAGVGLSSKLNAVFSLLTLVAWTPIGYLLFLRKPYALGFRRRGLLLLASCYLLPLIVWSSMSTPDVVRKAAAAAVAFFLPLVLDLIRRRGELSWKVFAAYAAIPFLAAVTFVVLWPWLWAGEALSFSARLNMYWEGMARFSQSAREGFTDYPLRCVLFMTPPVLLVLALLGLGEVRTLPALRGNQQAQAERLGIFLLLLLWFAFPLARIAAPHSMFYDANRHFLEYVPALCLFAGLGVRTVVDWLEARSRRVLIAGATVLAGGCAAALIVPIVDYHPFEVTYFNALAGGLGKAQSDALLFVEGEDWRSPGTEGDYWHASLRDFLSHVGPIVPKEAVIGTCGTVYRQAEANWEGPPLHYVDIHERGEYLYAAPRESFCSWSQLRMHESQRPVLLRVMRDGGLIYEILGPPTDYPLPPVSPRTRYDPPLAVVQG